MFKDAIKVYPASPTSFPVAIIRSYTFQFGTRNKEIGFVGYCFFLSEESIRYTNFRLAKFYWLLERYVFHPLQPNAAVKRRQL
jgi:hypothetical protein